MKDPQNNLEWVTIIKLEVILHRSISQKHWNKTNSFSVKENLYQATKHREDKPGLDQSVPELEAVQLHSD